MGRNNFIWQRLAGCIGVAASGAAAAVTVEDYARAERFLPWNETRYVINGDIQHHWIGNEDRFWYLRTSAAGGNEFIVVDAANGRKEPAFDQRKLAAVLSRQTGGRIEGDRLPFSSFRYVQHRRAIQFQFAAKLWTCQLATPTCRFTASGAVSEVVSPDGRWAAFLKEYNIWIRPTAAGTPFPLTMDGIEHYGYGAPPGDSTHAVSDARHPGPVPPQVIWSPNSRYVLTHRLDEREVKDLFLIQSVPEDGSFRPRLYSYRYAMPGDDQVPRLEPVVLDVMARRQVKLSAVPLIGEVWTLIERQETWWSADSQRVYYLSWDRFAKSVALDRADPVTGVVREVIRETSDTSVPINAVSVVNAVRTLNNGDVIWYSERDGWAHLYYYDGATGVLRNQITRGDWGVRTIVRIDERAGRVYFTASGREAGRNPYDQYLYSVRFDGSETRLLTPEDADHEIFAALPDSSFDDMPSTRAETDKFSPSGRYFVDSYSKPDRPPVLALRAADGRLIKQLERADISKLQEGGFRPVEPFQALAADGKTPLFGNVYRPSGFDGARSYPVIDAIYPGLRTRRTFVAATFDYFGAQSLAELGFVVVTVDGRGTGWRSKSFLDYSYGRMEKTSDLEDHIAVLRQLATRYPYMDLERVGADGISGGGYAAAHALLAYPDFYKVAVSAEGNHDQRGYLAAWGETFIGPFDEERYREASNIPLAASLQGKLLLMHGEMDDNVSPALTLKLVDALIKANKDFELLIIPNGNHATSFVSPYFIRRKWDYFVRNLARAEAPVGYEIRQPSWFAKSIGAVEPQGSQEDAR